MPNRVIHFEIQADDIERAKMFYEKSFGWKIEQWMEKEKGEMDYWGLITGSESEPGINGGLYERQKDNPLHTYDCTLGVKNIDEAIEAVKKNGGKVLREKMEMEGLGFFARCTDTEGNTFGLMQAAGQPTQMK